MWKHPKYYKELRKRAREQTASWYKELRKRNNSDQAISDEASTEATSVRPGPGHKLDVPAPAGPSVKQQAASDSQVVNQVKLSSQSQAASTSKPQATSKGKLQATSSKRQASE